MRQEPEEVAGLRRTVGSHQNEHVRSVENAPIYNLCDTVVIKQSDAFEYCTVRLSELACYKSEYCCQAERIGLRGGPKSGPGTKRSSASETDTWGLRD